MPLHDSTKDWPRDLFLSAVHRGLIPLDEALFQYCAALSRAEATRLIAQQKVVGVITPEQPWGITREEV